MNTNTIEREVAIAAPIDRVWTLITEAEHLGTWFGDAGAEIDLRPGGALAVRWDGHTLLGTVDAVEPTSRFAFRWHQLDTPAGAELSERNSTLVEFSLTTDGDTTNVRVVESGFSSLALPESEQQEMHAGHSEGWTMELAELETHALRVAA
ncbi:MAG: Activator of Hsp90 ATPase 1 family protein [Aeromicrobium sp.]|nr:Activator of Hsp90 ATPase 1 family protein [Aeromicrobium sp.]